MSRRVTNAFLLLHIVSCAMLLLPGFWFAWWPTVTTGIVCSICLPAGILCISIAEQRDLRAWDSRKCRRQSSGVLHLPDGGKVYLSRFAQVIDQHATGGWQRERPIAYRIDADIDGESWR